MKKHQIKLTMIIGYELFERMHGKYNYTIELQPMKHGHDTRHVDTNNNYENDMIQWDHMRVLCRCRTLDTGA
jgi:hypothetical protein